MDWPADPPVVPSPNSIFGSIGRLDNHGCDFIASCICNSTDRNWKSVNRFGTVVKVTREQQI